MNGAMDAIDVYVTLKLREGAAFTSRLVARCTRCWHTSSRTSFHRVRPDNVPKFEDVCPKCGSNEVEVADPNHVRFE